MIVWQTIECSHGGAEGFDVLGRSELSPAHVEYLSSSFVDDAGSSNSFRQRTEQHKTKPSQQTFNLRFLHFLNKFLGSQLYLSHIGKDPCAFARILTVRTIFNLSLNNYYCYQQFPIFIFVGNKDGSKRGEVHSFQFGIWKRNGRSCPRLSEGNLVILHFTMQLPSRFA